VTPESRNHFDFCLPAEALAKAGFYFMSAITLQMKIEVLA